MSLSREKTQQLLEYVHGAVFLHNYNSNLFVTFEAKTVKRLAQETYEIVYLYLIGHKELDDSFSTLQKRIAVNAKMLFLS